MLHRETFDFESSGTGRPFRAVFEPAQPGVRFHEKPVVKFFDRTHMHTPDGQFTGGSYYLDTLLPGLQRRDHGGLDLYGGEPAWKLSGVDMRKVLRAAEAWLNEERTYLVGVPASVTVDKFGAVSLTLHAEEISDRHFGEDIDLEEEGLTEEQIEADRASIDRAITNHTASITY